MAAANWTTTGNYPYNWIVRKEGGRWIVLCDNAIEGKFSTKSEAVSTAREDIHDVIESPNVERDCELTILTADGNVQDTHRYPKN